MFFKKESGLMEHIDLNCHCNKGDLFGRIKWIHFTEDTLNKSLNITFVAPLILCTYPFADTLLWSPEFALKPCSKI